MREKKLKCKNVFKRIATFLLSVPLLIQPMSITANAFGWPSYPNWPDQGGSGSSTKSIGHIDIGVDLTATLIINGELTETEFTIGTEDAQYITITANPSDTEFSLSGGVSTNTNDGGEKQIRIEGSFPVGTSSSPVYYTVTLSKTIVLNNGIAVPVTLSTTTQYWDSANICPGFTQNPSSMSGIDLRLNNGTGTTNTKGTFQIQKTLSGVAPKNDITYHYRIFDAAGNVYKDNVELKVPAGHKTASIVLTNMDFGTYSIEETSSPSEIEGTILNGLHYDPSNSFTLASNMSNSAVNVTSTYSLPRKEVYTIQFINFDGSIIESTEYEEGTTINVPSVPTRISEEPEKYNWVFDGWDKEISSVAENNAVYTATYRKEPVKYSVTFVDWNDSIISQNNYEYEEAPIIPENPVRENTEKALYEFIGWDKQITNVTENVTYKATYKETKLYTVEFRNWDQSTISKVNYEEGSLIAIPPTPARKADHEYSYTFAGWDKEVSNTANSDIIYTAVYEETPVDYIITFKNWDNTILSECTYHYGDTVIAPLNVVRPADSEYAYTFIGWNENIETTVTSNKTYTAVYEASAIEYLVTFKNWNGSILSETNYNYGDVIAIPNNTTRPSDNMYHYTFMSWDKPVEEVVTSSAIYTAIYKETLIEYSVVFKNWDGTEISNTIYNYGNEVVIPSNVTRPSDKEYQYIFKGWNKEVETIVTANETYTAVYEKTPIEYTITFKDWDDSIIDSFNCHYGDVVTSPENMNRPSDNKYTYTFIGWDKDVEDTVTASVTYTAVYECQAIEYTVIFKNWDGTEISNDIYHYGDEIIVPTGITRPMDERFYYEFVGWDQTVEYNVTSNKTYVAIYEKTEVEYTVTFKNWDGTVISEIGYKYGDFVTIPVNVTRPADNKFFYTFIGWDLEVEEIVYNDMTYIALYKEEAIEYTIIFKDWNNEIISNNFYNYEDTVKVPTNVTRPADKEYTYTFVGWDKEVETSVVGNATYTAVYEKTAIEYTVVFKDWNGKILSETIYHYGDNVNVPENVKRPSDKQYTYTFTGWDNEVVTVTNNATYTAQYDATLNEYTITWVVDGIETTSSVTYGKMPTFAGRTDKTADAQYTYTFTGWKPELTEVTDNAVYTAQYEETVNEYTVTWIVDGVQTTNTVAYGETPVFAGSTDKAADAQYTYTFAGWNPEIAEVTNNAVYTAQYNTSVNSYTVTWMVDGNETTETYEYGMIPSFKGSTYKTADKQYTYTFTDWDKDVVEVTGDTTYTALFKNTFVEYAVIFKNWNDEVISSKTYHYENKIEVPTNVTRPSNKAHFYTFAGWDKDIEENVTSDVTYTAIFNEECIKYNVTFMGWDNSYASNNEYHYGDKVEMPTNITKPSDKKFHYTFTGWDKEVEDTVTGNAVYKPMFEETYVEYNILFKNWDDSVLSEKIYHYEDEIELPETPKRESDLVYSYKFSNWDKDVQTSVENHASYTAVFEPTYIDYQIQFIDWDDTLIAEELYHYNDEIVEPEKPTRASDSQYNYTFAGWDKEISTVTGDTIYKATYDRTKIVHHSGHSNSGNHTTSNNNIQNNTQFVESPRTGYKDYSFLYFSLSIIFALGSLITKKKSKR